MGSSGRIAIRLILRDSNPAATTAYSLLPEVNMPKCSNCGFIFRYDKCPRCGTLADVKSSPSEMKPSVSQKEENKSDLNQFFEIACSITTTSDVDAVLKKVGSAAEKLTLTMASSIMLLDDDKKNLYFKVASGDKGTILTKLKVPVGEGIAGWVAANKEPLIIQDVSVDPRFTGKIDSESGFRTKSILCVPLIVNDELVGVAEVLNKIDGSNFTENDKAILTSLSNFAAVAIVNARNISNQQNFFANVFEILTNAFESSDRRFSGHCFKVAQLSTAIARELNITGQQYKDIYYAAILHDVGFIIEPEYSIMEHGTNKIHPLNGFEMIKNINLLKSAADLIKYHHLMYDGSGFPAEGLKKEAIPVGSRIISLVEAVEDMRFSVYPEEKIRQMVESQKGMKFDPVIADIFLKISE
ncbi:MAG: GAF domain-containing protein [Elusimicrobia bacterium]|nr:GAF domain-containing protein [Elusimicrobiota bacterium]